MKHLRQLLLGAAALTLCAGISAAQRGGGSTGNTANQPSVLPDDLLQQLLGGGGRTRGTRNPRGGGALGGGRAGYDGEYLTGNEPIDIPLNRNGIADWATDPQFKADTFTFVRLRFTNAPGNRGGFGGFGGGGGGGTGHSWLNDWPQADMNISFRLQQMTALKVNPTPIRLAITDPAVLNYPFAFMEQVGIAQFTTPEIAALRRYLLNGGFLMVDDHWGEAEQQNWALQMSRVFPERHAEVLTVDHPIFHSVFNFKTLPQVPTLQTWQQSARAGDPDQTSKRNVNYAPAVYRAISDDTGRMMVLEDANTDTPDAWEREGDEEVYFHRFAEKVAYPFMINVVFYAMTH